MPGKPLVVFADVYVEGPLPRYFATLLAEAEVLSPDHCTPEAIAAARSQAVAWVSRLAPVSEAHLALMPRLKLLSAWGVGHDHIDVEAATARGIPVCINPVFSRSVAEATLALILALSKRLPHLMRDARTGRRPPEFERGHEIRGKTLGIVGYGRIGREIGELGHRLDMNVVTYDPYLPAEARPAWCHQVTLQAICQTADYLVLAAPLTPETHHMIGAEQLALMKSSAFLVNIGRGPLVDEAALLAALQQGTIAGAGIDVWEVEPLRPDNPLLALDNVIGTPHKLASTWESLEQVCSAIQSNILRMLAGQQPENVVNPQVLR